MASVTSLIVAWGIVALAVIVLALALPLNVALAEEASPSGSTPAVPQVPWSDIDQELLGQYGLSLEMLHSVSKGFEDGTWQPWQPVTRAQFVAFATASFGLEPMDPEAPTFDDVSESHVHFGAIEAAVGAGIINGLSEGVFAPDEPITREQAAAIIVRYLAAANDRVIPVIMAPETVEFHLSAYADGDEVSEVHRDEVALACARAMLKGAQDEDGVSLSPGAPLMRIQAAAMATRLERPSGAAAAGEDALLLGLNWAKIGSWAIEKAGGTAISWGVNTGLTALWNWITGGGSQPDPWDQVNQQLQEIQSQLTEIQQGLTQLSAQMDQLAKEFQVAYAKLTSLIVTQRAQGAMMAVNSLEGAVGVYGTYADLTSKQSTAAPNDTAKAALNAELVQFYQSVGDPSAGAWPQINVMYRSIFPLDQSPPLLDTFLGALCSGALSDQELVDAYCDFEAYFCQLVTSQTLALQMLIQYDNYKDPTGVTAQALTTQTWPSYLQAECDDFLRNVVSMCLRYGQYPSTQHMLGSDTLRQILQRAVYCYNQILEQLTLQAGKSAQDAYWFQVLEIAPAGIYRPSGVAAYAGALLVPQASVHDCGVADGPAALVWSDSAMTVDVTRDFHVWLYRYPREAELQRDSGITVCDASAGQAVAYDVAPNMQNYDTSYTPVPAGTAGSVVYGLGLKDCSHQYGQAGAANWWLPVALGGSGNQQWTRATFTNPQGYAVDSSQLNTGLLQVNCNAPSGGVAVPSSGVGFTVEWRLPSFTYVGTKPMTYSMVVGGIPPSGSKVLQGLMSNPSFAGAAPLAHVDFMVAAGYRDATILSQTVSQVCVNMDSDPGWYPFMRSQLDPVTLTLQPNHSYSLLVQGSLNLKWASSSKRANWQYGFTLQSYSTQIKPSGS